jgi:hypothetical protein
MRIDSVVPDCAKLPSPLLTVFVNTAGNDASRHPRERVDMAWFLDAADTLRHALSHRDAKAFERQANRVRRFLEQRHPAEKALVIFAGAKAWKVIPLEAPVIHELRWGKPNIAPLLPLLNGHRRYCAVVMDHFAARYFQYEHGELISLGTKEFRLAGLRAKTRDILTQFLVEAVTLSIAGGCVGVFLGIAASMVISRLASWNTVVSMGAVLLAVFFSGFVGISFGYYPARKAAYLDPIEALRSE